MGHTGNEARQFVRGHQAGVLSTLSQRLAGYPFGSVMPFMLDHAGCPVILISTLAEHTRNIQADARVSLIVQPFTQAMHEAGRVTLIGQASRLPDKDVLGPRYLRYFPKAGAYLQMHDFEFYRIEPVRIRFIGGFGKIHWVEPAQYLLETGALAGAEDGILQHMNADHRHTLRDYCRHIHHTETDEVEMIGIDPDGFDVRAGEAILRFGFPAQVTDAGTARNALVQLAQSCRR